MYLFTNTFLRFIQLFNKLNLIICNFNKFYYKIMSYKNNQLIFIVIILVKYNFLYNNKILDTYFIRN